MAKPLSRRTAFSAVNPPIWPLCQTTARPLKADRTRPNPYELPSGMGKPLEVVMALKEAGETTFPLVRALSQATRSYTFELSAPAANAADRSHRIAGTRPAPLLV